MKIGGCFVHRDILLFNGSSQACIYRRFVYAELAGR